MKRLSLFGGLALLLLVALAGCEPSKNQGATAESGPPGAGTRAANAAASASAQAFNKPRKPDGPISIKVITNGNSPFWDSMGEGLKVGLKEVGAQGGWAAPPQTDNSSQKAVFESALSANVDGIAVSPIQADAFAPVIDAAIDKGVPVITFDSDAPKSKRLAYIGTDNYQAGIKAGEEAVRLLPNGGSFVAFVGNMTAENAQKRYQGFLDAVKGHNITMLQDPYEDDKDAVGRAHANVADAITKYGNKINGFLGLYSYNGPAIVDEVQKAGLIGKVKIVCFDGEPRTLDNLERGVVDATVVQKPYEFGRLSAKLLYLINRKGLEAALSQLQPELDQLGMKRNGNIIDTGVTVVTPANAKEFIKDLHAKHLTST
ncbi:MAG TPA: sugar-binding protein [Chthonomonadaceae bacterium]|nr:sugar-binding protein [Chthonomonadaceae bacterium]